MNDVTRGWNILSVSYITWSIQGYWLGQRTAGHKYLLLVYADSMLDQTKGNKYNLIIQKVEQFRVKLSSGIGLFNNILFNCVDTP